MLSKKKTRLLLLLSILALVIGVIGTTINDDTILLPHLVADILRFLVMTQAGFSVLKLLLMIREIRKVRIDKTDELMEPALALVLSNLVMTGFVMLNLILWLGQPFLTFRTPMAFLGLLIADYAAINLGSRLSRILTGAEGGVVKLTMTLTNKPGLDIDLSGQSAGVDVQGKS